MICVIFLVGFITLVGCTKQKVVLDEELLLQYKGQKIAKGVRFSGILVENKDLADIQDLFFEMGEALKQEAKSATYNPKTWEIRKEQAGIELDLQKTVEILMRAKAYEEVKPILKKTPAKIVYHQLKEKISEVGSYQTPIVQSHEGRIFNIDLATSAIQYLVVQPQENFSFNDAVGPCTKERGYVEAPVIFQTPEGPVMDLGSGGGICQLSSTLYNAAVMAGMQIIERHPHSMPVSYVPRNQDATIVWGVKDLKFKNTRSYPVMIQIARDGLGLKAVLIENAWRG